MLSINKLASRIGGHLDGILYGEELAAIRWHQDQIDQIRARRESGEPMDPEADAMRTYLVTRRALRRSR